jgi:hypothetical protein
MDMPTHRCDVTYDHDARTVIMDWQGYFPSAEFRAANERVLTVVQATAATRLLGDITHFVLIGADDQAWLNENWIPRLIRAGVQRCALVQPTYYFNRVAVENVGRQVDADRLAIGYFGDRESARRWLLEGQGPAAC